VLEVIAAVEKVSGRKVNVLDAPRREGDPARLVADARLARQRLRWSPAYGDVEIIVEHAWQWEQVRCRAGLKGVTEERDRRGVTGGRD
jgi:UDP-glucose 4-epimerase